MSGFIALVFFGAAAWGAIHLWQQHNRRAKIRNLEDRREDLKDLTEQVDLEEEIETEEDVLRRRGVDLDDESK